MDIFNSPETWQKNDTLKALALKSIKTQLNTKKENTIILEALGNDFNAKLNYDQPIKGIEGQHKHRKEGKDNTAHAFYHLFKIADAIDVLYDKTDTCECTIQAIINVKNIHLSHQYRVRRETEGKIQGPFGELKYSIYYNLTYDSYEATHKFCVTCRFNGIPSLHQVIQVITGEREGILWPPVLEDETTKLKLRRAYIQAKYVRKHRGMIYPEELINIRLPEKEEEFTILNVRTWLRDPRSMIYDINKEMRRQLHINIRTYAKRRRGYLAYELKAELIT